MTNYVYIATSLDGFIATSNGGLEWLEELPNPEQSDYGYAEFMKSIDAIMMGRNTFEKVLTFAQWVYNKPVFILSNSLTKLPDDILDKAEIIKGDIKKLISQLNQKGYKNLYIDGGQVIQSFLQEDLIDEIIITRVPIILGKGVSLFGEREKPLKFRHQKTQIYNNILVKSHYIRER
ncbi:bifunctional deaminase-reductase domain protein [Rippkaea orientalis PCC 8801]|uniref:Bifunctional deaminase-reductase domain protein n=1 Tax=Rippkaea orientalis (strain PCC 8801 / RF-1) TaxID=41431 RepID=B7JXG7_RIPO1|nr:dihydrofolate reductase family protein [Rippkaea orientalis]ACK64724.1 bifunctional deaminase-reductase domain protein [Rippkaea orientalis PCC 8801]